jgi:hypothetical protein
VLIIGDRLAQYQHTGITFRLGRLLITFL